MPLIIKDYQWSETKDTVFVQVPLKGVVPAKTDVYSNDSYLKVHFPPYLFELDLLHPIDHQASIASVGNGVVKFTLAKRKDTGSGDAGETGLWGAIQFVGRDAAEVRERRAAAEARQRAEEEEAKRRKREAKVAEERALVEQQILVERQRREQVEALKEQESLAAQQDLQQWVSKSSSSLSGSDAVMVASAKPPVDETTSASRSRGPQPGASMFEGQEDDDEDIDMAAIRSKVQAQLKGKERPPPRGAGQAISFTFTSRGPLPTKTARESEDAKWMARIQQMKAAHERKAAAASAASVDATTADTEGAAAHPVLLRDKGNAFYKAANFPAAINAYTAALDVDPGNLPCLANRSACHLQLGRWIECVEDCTSLLAFLAQQEELLREHLVQDDAQGAQRRNGMRVKALVRMGTAKANMGDLKGSVQDYQLALQLAPHNEGIQTDLDALLQRQREAGALPAAQAA